MQNKVTGEFRRGSPFHSSQTGLGNAVRLPRAGVGGGGVVSYPDPTVRIAYSMTSRTLRHHTSSKNYFKFWPNAQAIAHISYNVTAVQYNNSSQ